MSFLLPVKGVNFFGDRSQFIVSGSDCGHVFLWDKDTESIINFFRGDESGVVSISIIYILHSAAAIYAVVLWLGNCWELNILDYNGAQVNCLEGHPSAPILATSGLDDDIKIWVPSHEKQPQMMDLAATVRKNIKRREDDLKSQPESDNYIMWALINQMRSVRRGQQVILNLPYFSGLGFLV